MNAARLISRVGLGGVLLALVALASLAGAVEPDLPKPQGFVSDYAGVLDASTRQRLDAVIGELKSKTGAEIAVVVVRSTQPLTAFDYAMKIAEAWKPGDRAKDNGVVFLVAVNDRSMFILTGYGVEGVLPDGRVGEIRDRLVVPAFRRGDYSGGIRAATETMAGLIAADAGVKLTGVAPPQLHQGVQLSPLQTAFLILVVIAVLWVMTQTGAWPLLLGGGPGRYRGGGFGGGFGGGGFGGGGGGFGGFGGGDFGGGGAGGNW